MIEAFKSTLEESLSASLILLLIDSSQPVEEIRIKYLSCWEILEELKVDRDKVIVIFTKNDSTDLIRIQEIITDLAIHAPYAISAKTGFGIRKLKTIVSQQITIKSQKKSFKLLTHGKAVF
jgi:GTP-binding protein HflX